MNPRAPFQNDFESPVIPKAKSIAKMINAIITDEITTIIVFA